jgi:hypothetical protein
MVAHHLSFVFGNANAILSWRTESRFLPEAERRRDMAMQVLTGAVVPAAWGTSLSATVIG